MKEEMRVLFISTAFSRSEKDTITPWLTKTLRLLKEKGLNVDVFTSAYKGLSYNRVHGIDVFRFRYFFSGMENLTHEEMTLERMKKGMIYKILPLFYIISGVIGIFRHCKKKNYDMIHVHWPVPHFLFGYIASRICRCPVVSTFHGVGLRYVKNSGFLMRRFLKFVVRKSDLITVNSSHTASELKYYDLKRLKIIPFGAAVDSAGKYFKDKIEKKKDSVKLLFVGRLVERKGVVYLLDALKILHRRGLSEVTLIVVGEGNRREFLEKKAGEMEISDKVCFKGRVSGKELVKQYKSCDIFVLPAVIDSTGDTEGLGVVLIEALSFKKPVVASRVGGIVDIVKDKETGLLVEQKSPEMLAEALQFLIENPDKSKKLAASGYRYVKKYFSWDNIINSIIDSYRNLLK